MEGKEASLHCLDCLNPLCQTGCPVGNHIRDFVQAVKKGELSEAAAILYSVNPFPEFTSALCDHARQCKGHCVRGIKGEPVQIPSIEGYLASNFPRDLTKKSANGRRIALIGAGIANLTAAFFLAKDGCSIDVYEKDSHVGGAIYTGIPQFRFDKAVLAKTQGDLEQMGVRFLLGEEIGKDITLDALLSQYDAVLASIGAQKENMPSFTASRGLLSGLDLLRGLNLSDQDYPWAHKCLVWGGGNVAMDCARSLARLGKEVTVIYRRSRMEMPANADEVEKAMKEGIHFAFLSNVKELVKNGNDGVVGVKTVRMELGEKDSSGRASFHEIPDSDDMVPCDLLVPAIGQKVDFAPLGAQVEKEERHESNIQGLFLAGDCRLGPKNIASCIKDGREAAFEILEYLKD